MFGSTKIRDTPKVSPGDRGAIMPRNKCRVSNGLNDKMGWRYFQANNVTGDSALNPPVLLLSGT